jgi:histone-binding protein RBBP4
MSKHWPLILSNNSAVKKFIVGTHTSGGEQNSLMIFKVKIPRKENEKDVKDNVNKGESKIELETKLHHDGEVNRARVCPYGDHNLIATKTVKGEVHIFNYFKHPPKPSEPHTKPEQRLTGHNAEGYGLSWSRLKQGYIASGGTDNKVWYYLNI